MDNLDKQYQSLLQDILDNGVKKETRNGGTLSVFGRQIRHNMKNGFPLLTTKKMPFRLIATELMWFLRGDTNIKFLVDNNCHIWDGDAYKNYCEHQSRQLIKGCTYQEFIDKIKTDDEFAKKWGDLGSIYGKQWRSWKEGEYTTPLGLDGPSVWKEGIDQIQNLINDLKTNPDSRRLMVNAWNVGELDHMVLPPCHYGFQVYTRELKKLERINIAIERKLKHETARLTKDFDYQKWCDEQNIPTRAISLMWNQRSVDTFLGLPFNIASYGLLLEIIAKAVNMIPDELIGNLGDTHLYLNHIEQATEQIGKDLTCDERIELASTDIHFDPGDFGVGPQVSNESIHAVCDLYGVPRKLRQPFELPELNINTEFWPTESGECGEGPIDAQAVFNNFTDEHFCKCLLESDLQLSNYQSHPHIKAQLSN